MTTPEKINIFISTISAIATVAAAIIYFRTLREIRRQTSNTYRPHLFIDTIGFHVIGVTQNEITMPTFWADENIERNTIYNFDQNQNTNVFHLKCYNIGFGTAKKVQIAFKYDLNALLESISKLEKYITDEIKIRIDFNGNFVFLEAKDKKMPYLGGGISFINTLKDYRSYILPVNISNDFVKIQVPMLYLELMNIFIFYLASIENKKDLDIDKIISSSLPKIYSTITYNDIYNKSEKLDIEISVILGMWGKGGYAGRFEVTEKNFS